MSSRRFVTATLASCFAVLAAVLALNVVVDPFALSDAGIVPTAVENDRSVKLDLIERLPAAPEILVLGSSRARQAEPGFLRALTGHGGFNAGVTGGTAADAWVFTRFAADRFPGVRRRYIWFVDVGLAVRGVNPQLAEDPRAARYLPDAARRFGLHDIGTYLGLDATRASVRVLRSCVLHDCTAPSIYRADGSIRRSQLASLPEHERGVETAAAALARSVSDSVPAATGIDTRRYRLFERTIAYMNARGERPVLVLNPIYPSVLAAFRRRGFRELADSLAYLRALRARGLRFELVNCEDIRTWGGRAADFANPTHVNLRNMQRMLRYVVEHSNGALS